MDRSLFRHTFQLRVRNYEVDWQGIVHNANYLLYFEVGRIEYLKAIGVEIDAQRIQSSSKVVLVRNEIDYKSSARFDELLNIYTRIFYIKNTSFAFEGFIEEEGSHRLVAENVAVHVWLDSKTGEPSSVNGEFRRKIREFEGKNVVIESPTIFT